MLTSFLSVGNQVLILFILMAVGFILGKANVMNQEANRVMSNVVLFVVAPCALISSFQRELIVSDLKKFGICVILAVVIQVGTIFVCKLLIHSKNKDNQDVLRFTTIFSNCGFMAYPLQTALLGSIGVFFGSAYMAIFFLLVYTYGVYLIAKDRSLLKIKPIITNPGVIGVVLALALYLLQIRLPDIILTPVNYLASLNTPVPMLIIGYQLSKADFKSVFKDKASYVAAFVRLILIPLIAMGLCLLLRLDVVVTSAIVIAASTPPGAIVGMLCAKYNKDSSFASSVLSVQTLVSVLTMSVMVALARYLCGVLY